MCGICGIFEFSNKVIDREKLIKMNNTLSHRGPDDSGLYINNNIGLAHRRLAIIDIKSGHQPMLDDEQKIAVVYNGEIYNFLELKEQLQKYNFKFKTNSDTEVLLNAYKYWNVDCLKYICGMFAFAIWDDNKKQLFLARDQVGIKPLLYYFGNNNFIFSSEFQALLQYPEISRKLNLSSLSDYISFQCVPSENTMFEDIKRLEPGHCLIVKENKIKIERYWFPDYSQKLNLSENEAINETFNYFKHIVKQHLISDVPLGLFLSGGIDSTLVTAAVREVSSNKIKTFSIGFEYEPLSELKYSRSASKILETEHTEIILKPNVLNVLPKLVEHYGEPFADSSAIPTYYIAQETRKYVTVALAGDGGDELFAGYDVFGQMNLSYKINSLLTAFHFLFKTARNIYGKKDSKQKLPKLFRFLDIISGQKNDIYPLLRCSYYNELKVKLFNQDFKNKIDLLNSYKLYKKYYEETTATNLIEKILDTDLRFTLPYDLLTKVDIASMANSLEIRVPFLDKRFIEFALKLPSEYKIKNKTGKYILKKILKKYFDDKFIYRKKMGFSIPLAKWLREEMREYCRDILFSDAEINRKFFNEDYLKKIFDDHIQIKEDNSATLWLLMNFKLWLKTFKVDYNV